MATPIERGFGEKFLQSIDNFYTHGIDWLFNEWWETAPTDAIAKDMLYMRMFCRTCADKMTEDNSSGTGGKAGS